MFYRDKYIYEYNTYKYMKCLLYRYALNVCTESERANRSEQNDRGVKRPQQIHEERSVKKKTKQKTKTCVKITCELQLFSKP